MLTRCGVVTASARTVPALACRYVVVMLSMARSMKPPIMLFISSEVLRNGMWVICAPVAASNMTTDKCDVVPIPAEP